MVLVSDLDHIGRINSTLNTSLANIKMKKLKFVWNTAPDNQRDLNFNPKHILVYNYTQNAMRTYKPIMFINT